MYNLFIKDFYLIKKHIWIAILYSFMLFIVFTPQAFEIEGAVYSMGIAMIGYTMIMYITAYDDKNDSLALLNSLPISRSKIVLARYLSIIAFSLIGLIGMLISWFVLNTIDVVEISRFIKPQDYIGALIGLCGLSFLYLPAYYKFGYVKAKMFNLILFVIGFGAPMVLKSLIREVEKPQWVDNFTQYINSSSDLKLLITLVTSILVFGAISYICSLWLYKKRVF